MEAELDEKTAAAVDQRVEERLKQLLADPKFLLQLHQRMQSAAWGNADLRVAREDRSD